MTILNRSPDLPLDQLKLKCDVDSNTPLTGKESPYASKEGWLLKQGNYIKNWRKRWFQLKDGILLYYKDPTVEVKPTNFFVLAGSKTQECTRYGSTCFEFIMANGDKRYLQADSQQGRDDWIQILNTFSNKRPISIIHDIQNQGKLDAHSFWRATTQSVPGSKFLADRKLTAEDFDFHKVLGKGNYGKVMLATLKEGDGRYFAVKVIKKSILIDEESLDHVLAENRVLQTLDHPFLVKLYCSFQTSDRLYFVMEYVCGGELFFHIGRERRFSESRVRFYASQMVLALHHLHQKEIVYRDMKLENLLLDAEGNIKITDFGLVKDGIGTHDMTSTFCGTPEYLPPEVLEEENYGRSVDWWSLGIVLYELLVGRPPFTHSQNMEKLFYNILHEPISYPPELAPETKAFLSALLERDFTRRLGSSPSDGEEIKSHVFFKGMDWNQVLKKSLTPPFKPLVSNQMDVGNFDREFTIMPPILTPSDVIALESDMVRSNLNDLKNFSYLDSSFIR